MGLGYEISVQDVAQILEAFDGHLADFAGAAADLSRLTVPAVSFGQVGNAAAGAGASTHDQLTATLQVLATVLHKLNERIRASAQGYDAADRQVAGELSRLTP